MCPTSRDSTRGAEYTTTASLRVVPPSESGAFGGRVTSATLITRHDECPPAFRTVFDSERRLSRDRVRALEPDFFLIQRTRRALKNVPRAASAFRRIGPDAKRTQRPARAHPFAASRSDGVSYRGLGLARLRRNRPPGAHARSIPPRRPTFRTSSCDTRVAFEHDRLSGTRRRGRRVFPSRRRRAYRSGVRRETRSNGVYPPRRTVVVDPCAHARYHADTDDSRRRIDRPTWTARVGSGENLHPRAYASLRPRPRWFF